MQSSSVTLHLLISSKVLFFFFFENKSCHRITPNDLFSKKYSTLKNLRFFLRINSVLSNNYSFKNSADSFQLFYSNLSTTIEKISILETQNFRRDRAISPTSLRFFLISINSVLSNNYCLAFKNSAPAISFIKLETQKYSRVA